MVLLLSKYCIGLWTRFPVSIGNILEDWFLTDPTKYWNILETLVPGAGISSRHELFLQKVGRLGSIWSFYCVILVFEAIWSHFL